MKIIGNISSDGFAIFEGDRILKLKNEISDTLAWHTKFIIDRTKPDLYFDLEKLYSEYDDLTSLLSAIHKLEKNNEITKVCYEVFPSIPAIVGLINHPMIVEILKHSGVSIPQVGGLPGVRIDRPCEDFRLTPWHQDIWYSMLSMNSVVLWFPLLDLEDEMGLLHIIRGSHQLGIVPFKKNELSPEPFTTTEDFDSSNHQYETISIKKNQILVFNQCLLHKSGKNRSSKIRITLQLRFNDMKTSKILTTSFTDKSSPYTKMLQNLHLNERNGT
jgi:Phytanoyl-CoA dioxygenase (PhyH)